MKELARYSAVFGTVCLVYALVYKGCDYIAKHPVRASEFNEVKPYVFAELPHGRIYKTVHEGCELYIVESDWEAAQTWGNHTYSITAGKGCK
jgi:hypothetical protein